jgi:hypothetical protein
VSKAKTYVYRLWVEYPEGSREYGWAPAGWAPEPQGDPDADTAFRWPAVHDFLSRRGAETRAKLLRGFGATVEVLRSDPVGWSSNVIWQDGDR